jgi:hypothetical protein
MRGLIQSEMRTRQPRPGTLVRQRPRRKTAGIRRRPEPDRIQHERTSRQGPRASPSSRLHGVWLLYAWLGRIEFRQCPARLLSRARKCGCRSKSYAPGMPYVPSRFSSSFRHAIMTETDFFIVGQLAAASVDCLGEVLSGFNRIARARGPRMHPASVQPHALAIVKLGRERRASSMRRRCRPLASPKSCLRCRRQLG